MRSPGRLPRVLETALRVTGGSCYRHCDRPLRVHRISSRLPGLWQVTACPSGIVSVTMYSEWSDRDPSSSVRPLLDAWTRPRSLVRRRDLRLASRHGPELGPTAERWLAEHPSSRTLRTIYWRVYPFRTRSGEERRLFVCRRASHPAPVFFAASPTSPTWACPVCRA